MISCTSRDEANLVAGTFARSVAPEAKTIVRTSSADYVEIWREGRLDVDFVVSSELETSRGVSAAIGMPAARGLMWLGRLEIVPVVVLLRRSYWRV